MPGADMDLTCSKAFDSDGKDHQNCSLASQWWSAKHWPPQCLGTKGLNNEPGSKA